MFKVSINSFHHNTGFSLSNTKFELHKGINFLIGNNGSGKSSILKCLSKIYDCKLQSDLKNTNYMPSSLELHESLFVEDLFHILLCNKEILNQLCKKLEINQLLNHKINQLSSGEIQRVKLAAHLSIECDWFLLDEPLNFLELKYHFTIKEIIQEFSSTKNFFIISHNLNWLINFPDAQTILIHKGQVQNQGPTTKVLISEELRKHLNINCKIICDNNNHYLHIDKI